MRMGWYVVFMSHDSCVLGSQDTRNVWGARTDANARRRADAVVVTIGSRV